MRIVVVAPHPDDETLGCGGSLLRHKEKGDEIYWIIVTEGDAIQGFDRTKREKEIKEVIRAYQFDEVFRLGFLASKLDIEPKANLVIKLREIFQHLMPNIVYSPFSGDPHTDHQVVAEAIVSATKNFRVASIKKILAYEVISETDFSLSLSLASFRPIVFHKIDAFIKKKLEIASLYASEIKPFPFPRSLEAIESLAKIRGVVAGCCFAESFMLLKEVV
jgi:LmbE family N-acetylglucosaminyl deacetylase